MATGGGSSTDEAESEKVVIEQRLLKLDEVFVYKIPAMKTADGFFAADWNLATPLATCSLIVNRRDDSLCINIMADRPKANAPPGATESYLFAQSIIQVKSAKSSHKLEHWVEPVVDSSRYFAMRIRDSRSGREAFIGIGFRERNDATNFRMTMEDYVAALKREEKAQVLHRQFEQSSEHQSSEGDGGGEQQPLPAMSNLSLKEGEKIHININGGGGSKRVTPAATKKVTPKKGLVGLRKPPPPPDANVATTRASFTGNTATSNTQEKDAEEDDDEWGDFEG
eukprot:CAMPEP_0201716004 /NCGR_PEP_ID=MMETSP0593-20130828/2078_1 /ASSEMBLY_ACC=CAM_ASM_000672 /TAXON_ID=267983 /ORGANISM="Skeletonema japonicum, Strain CCMP2506" /LENGTH=281 /DNA_ID=CAMNT_0048205677 /DNA_START=59 /DNA_END=904 /DNA_ORIENTATION=-